MIARSVRFRRAIVSLVPVILFATAAVFAADVENTVIDRDLPRPLHALGFTEPAEAPNAPFLWHVLRLDRAPSEEQVERVRQAAATARERGAELIVRLTRGDVSGDVQGRRTWLNFLRSLSRDVGPAVDWYLVDGLVSSDPALSAYEIKATAVTLRAEDERAGLAVGIRSDQVAELATTYRTAGDLAPFVDAIHVDEGDGLSASPWSQLLEFDPGASRWSSVSTGSDGSVAPAIGRLVAGADLALVGGDGAVLAKAAAMAAQLDPALGVSPTTGVGIEPPSGVTFLRLFDEKAFREILVYWSESARSEEVEWTFTSQLRRGYRVLDPLTNDESFRPAPQSGDGRVRVSTTVDAQPRLLIVQRQRSTPGIDVDDQSSEVRATGGVSAAEVIAAHLQWKSFQDDRLRSISREGQITFRPRFAATGTVNLTFAGEYYWEPDTGGEWLIRDKLVNGVRINWKKIPEFPLLNFNEVVQAPLELNLDRRYSFELIGDEIVEGRDCWEIDFEPEQENVQESLYRGTAWIDKRTGALIKVRSVQTNLEPPVVSNEETRIYRPYEGPDGTRYWLLDDIDGQLMQSITGRNLVVQIKKTFGEPTINAGSFESDRADAYASDMQMLRDTSEGLKWLDRKDDGSRDVRSEPKTRQLFALGGLLKDEGIGSVLPLGGVNYVDFDAFDRGLLLNVFFAGVLANVTLSDPTFLDSSWDVGANLNAIAVAGTDRIFIDGNEIEPENVERLTQSLNVYAGHAVGEFFRVRGSFGANFVNYSTADETAVDFTLPQDHTLLRSSIELSFDRKAWGVAGRGSYFTRTEWEPWGAAGSVVSAADANEAKDYFTYELDAQKAWFLPKFQQIELGVGYRTGQDLDRFSAFTFGFLGGDRLRGFGGSGIRYDEGWLADLEYSFNLRDIIRFDANLDFASVQELGAVDDSQHSGVGFAANFPGPWQTLVRLDFGYALNSDIEAIEGDTEILLVVLRLF